MLVIIVHCLFRLEIYWQFKHCHRPSSSCSSPLLSGRQAGGRAVCQPVCQPAGQSVRQACSQAASQSVMQECRQSVSQSDIYWFVAALFINALPAFLSSLKARFVIFQQCGQPLSLHSCNLLDPLGLLLRNLRVVFNYIIIFFYFQVQPSAFC